MYPVDERDAAPGVVDEGVYRAGVISSLYDERSWPELGHALRVRRTRRPSLRCGDV